MARPSGFENKLSTKSSSLGEIAVSFQLSPPPTSDIRIEDKKHIMDSVIVPEFNIMKISRPRSYSANDAIKEETELALEVNYPTCQNSSKLAGGINNNEMDENFGRVGLSGEVEMSRRRSHSIGEGYSGSRGGRNDEKNINSGTSNDHNVFFPSFPISKPSMKTSQNGLMKIPDVMVLKSPNGMAMFPKHKGNYPNGTMAIQNKNANYLNKVMRVVPDHVLGGTPSTLNGVMKIPHGTVPKTPVGLVMIPKGMVKPPRAVVKIPNGEVKSLPELMSTPGGLVESQNESINTHQNGKENLCDGRVVTWKGIDNKTQDDDMKAPDWLMKTIPAGNMDSQYVQLPCRPKTPKPQKPPSLATLKRRHVRPPPLHLQNTVAHPNSVIASGVKIQGASDSLTCPTIAESKRPEEHKTTSPGSPAIKKFILRVSLEEIAEGN